MHGSAPVTEQDIIDGMGAMESDSRICEITKKKLSTYVFFMKITFLTEVPNYSVNMSRQLKEISAKIHFGYVV